MTFWKMQKKEKEKKNMINKSAQTYWVCRGPNKGFAPISSGSQDQVHNTQVHNTQVHNTQGTITPAETGANTQGAPLEGPAG